jgi:APA family basic amino acid/polyamine antiporter
MLPGCEPRGSVPMSAPSPTHRRLTTFDVLCIGVNAIVGSGVFALPDDAQRAMGGFSPLAYLFCAMLLLPVALCFAELSSQSDRSGGPYRYAQEAFGNVVGFVVGWSCWLNAFVSWAAVTTLFVELCGVESPLWGKSLCVGMTLGLGVVNYVGVRPGAWLVNATVVGKLTAIFCFVAVGFFAIDPSRIGGEIPHGLAGVGNGIYIALFPLQGFEAVPVPAGEVKNPERAVPLGTVGSLLFAALLFVVVQAVLVMSFPGLGDESMTPLVDAARYVNPTLGSIVLVGGIVSVGGYMAGSALGSPRYAQAIAEDGLLPSPLSKIHARYDTPHVAIVATTVLAALLAVPFDYRQLIGMSNIAVVFQYASTCLAVMVLRRRRPSRPGAWRVPGGDVVPIIGAAGALGLLAGATREEVIFAAAALGLGPVVALASKRSRAEA